MPSLTSAPLLNRRNAVRLSSGGLAAAMVASGWRSAEAHNLTVLEANKALVHGVFAEGVNGGNVAVIGELYAPDFVDRGTWARQMPGPAGMPLTIAQFHEVVPDVTATVEMAIAEDDLVATLSEDVADPDAVVRGAVRRLRHEQDRERLRHHAPRG